MTDHPLPVPWHAARARFDGEPPSAGAPLSVRQATDIAGNTGPSMSPEAMGLSVDRKTFDSIKSRYDAGGPKQRARLIAAGGLVGKIARRIDETYLKTDAQGNPAIQALGGRLEDRVLYNTQLGMEPKAAARKAARDIVFSLPPARPESDTHAPTSSIGSTDFDFERHRELSPIGHYSLDAGGNEVYTPGASVLRRGIEAGGQAIHRFATGAHVALAEFAKGLGAPISDRWLNAAKKNHAAQSIRDSELGENPDTFSRWMEGAIASTVSQGPMWLSGVAGAKQVVPLLAMGISTAADEYANAREAGKTPKQAAARSLAYGSADAIGEALGFGDQVKLLKDAFRYKPLRDFQHRFVKTLAKQEIGEEGTTIAKWLTDQHKEIGLHPDATAADLYQQMIDTFAQTALQTGMMAAPGGIRTLAAHDKNWHGPNTTREADPARDKAPYARDRFGKPVQDRPRTGEIDPALLKATAAEEIQHAAHRTIGNQAPGTEAATRQPTPNRGSELPARAIDEQLPQQSGYEREQNPVGIKDSHGQNHGDSAPDNIGQDLSGVAGRALDKIPENLWQAVIDTAAKADGYGKFRRWANGFLTPRITGRLHQDGTLQSIYEEARKGKGRTATQAAKETETNHGKLATKPANSAAHPHPAIPGKPFKGIALDTGYEVPGIVSSSQDRKTVYIDKRIPAKITLGAKTFDPRPFMALREATERSLLDRGFPRKAANIAAAKAEKQAVAKAGINWKPYREFWYDQAGTLGHDANAAAQRQDEQGKNVANVASTAPGLGQTGAENGLSGRGRLDHQGATASERGAIANGGERVAKGAKQFEVLRESAITGSSRSAHRASANDALAEQLRADPDFAADMNKQLGTDVLKHMESGKSGLRNPPGTEWHHPKGNSDTIWLLRKETHRNPTLQDYLHQGGTGGFRDYYGQ